MFGRSLLLSLQIVLLQSICNITYAKALFGQNVRLTNDNEIPYTVCIAKYSPENPPVNNVVGTGVIISSNHVLTAASCLEELDTDAFEVLVGANHLLDCVVYYPIWWISYDQWTVERNLPIIPLNNDVAIIKILGLNHDIQPAPLSNARHSSVYYGLNVQIIGCGKSSNPIYSWRKQIGNAVVLNHEDCASRASHIEGHTLYLSVNYLCTAQVPFVQLAQGDTGGPLIYNGAVIGLNIGVAPPINQQFNPNKLNIHLYLHFYEFFINEIKLHDG